LPSLWPRHSPHRRRPHPLRLTARGASTSHLPPPNVETVRSFRSASTTGRLPVQWWAPPVA